LYRNVFLQRSARTVEKHIETAETRDRRIHRVHGRCRRFVTSVSMKNASRAAFSNLALRGLADVGA
jgi:hypothetical protein